MITCNYFNIPNLLHGYIHRIFFSVFNTNIGITILFIFMLYFLRLLLVLSKTLSFQFFNILFIRGLRQNRHSPPFQHPISNTQIQFQRVDSLYGIINQTLLQIIFSFPGHWVFLVGYWIFSSCQVLKLVDTTLMIMTISKHLFLQFGF